MSYGDQTTHILYHTHNLLVTKEIDHYNFIKPLSLCQIASPHSTLGFPLYFRPRILSFDNNKRLFFYSSVSSLLFNPEHTYYLFYRITYLVQELIYLSSILKFFPHRYIGSTI
ncbi:hypothetical protein SAMN05443144_11625 [Fodinibius roseus]|uniref:Uncharacterized protein n=1 Tax=Fodinibius roseus TaxID=1194090 RepID=A0A1M5FYM7_9BACT|nr:hypothetical protein SAMN05443144_11625 [Fodinibius roseus]